MPGSPVIGAANGGNGLATVDFAPPAQNGGSTIASYLVTASPGGRTAASTASPITVPGLTNGTAYTFAVAATNSVGTRAPSAPSNSVTPTATVPGAPTIGTATTGNALAVVRFTQPASNGGSAITNYTVTSTPGNFTGSGAGSPIAVPGLTNGTAYTFVVRASNAAGAGPASASSNSVTPTVTVASAPVIGSVTLSGAQATVSFNAPASNGGSAILTYTATCGSQSVTGTGSPLIVAGLTAGTTVFCSVSATNAVGTSAASAIGISAAPPPASCASINGPGLISIPATASTQTYNATCNNTAAYVWKLDGATLGCATSSCAIVFAASVLPATTTHTVTAAPSTATASVASLTVTQAAAALAPVCSGIIGPVSLSAIGGPYTYSANCVGATDYLWSLANSNFSNTDCSSGGVGTPTCRYVFNFNTGTAPVSYVIKITARNAAGIAPQQSVTVTMAAPPASCSLDFNGDGAVNTTDALLFSRWLLGFRNASLVSGITPYPAGTTAANFATAVTNRVVLGQVHDFDDNVAVDAATDGLLLLRLTQGLTGSAVTSGAVGLGSHRSTHDLIRTHVNIACGTNFAASALRGTTLATLSEYKYGDVWRDGNTTWAMAAKVVNATDYFTRPDGARAVRHQLFLLALNGGTLRATAVGEAYLQDNTFSQSAVWVQATNGNNVEFFWNEKRANNVYEMAGVRGIFSKLTNTVTSRTDNFVDQNMGWYPWLASDGLHHFNYSGSTEMLNNATGNATTPGTFIGQWNAQRTTHTGGVLPAPTDADVASRLCALHCVP